MEETLSAETAVASDEEQFEWVFVPPVRTRDDSDLAWQATAAELRERATELGKRHEDLQQQRVELRSRDVRRKDEVSLDDARHRLVEQWTAVDELSSLMREEHEWLDRRRTELAEQEHNHNTLNERLNSLQRQVDDVHEREGHSREYRILRGQFNELNSERNLKAEQLSARIVEYNLRYDKFIHALEIAITPAAKLMEDIGNWTQERRVHNEQVNKYNSDLHLLDASFDQWRYEDNRLRDDIGEFLGPLHLTPETIKILRHQLSKTIWRSHDRNTAGKLFEFLCADLLIEMGLRVIHSGGNDDGGIDIRAEETTRAGTKLHYFIQCKLRSNGGETGQISRSDLSKFIGDLPNNPADQKIFITLGDFDTAASGRAQEHGIGLWNGARLLEHLLNEGVGFNVRFGVEGFHVQINLGYWETLEDRIG